MSFNFQRQLKRLAVAGALSLCFGQSAWAGLCCGCGNVRPYYSPACEPTWGYHQTCWRRFPALQPCTGWGDYCAACDGGCGMGMSGEYQGNPNDGMMQPGMQYGGAEGYPSAAPVYPASPMVVPQQGGNGMNYPTPMSQGGGGYEAPINQPSQMNLQPQPSPQQQMYPQPMPDSPPYGQQPEPLQPYPGSMPPIPEQNSSSIRHFPNVYRQTGQPAGQFPVRGVRHVQAQNAEPLFQQMPIQQQQQQWFQQDPNANGGPQVFSYPQSNTNPQSQQMLIQMPQQVQPMPQQRGPTPVRGVSYTKPPSRYGFPEATEGTSSPFSFLSRFRSNK